MRTRFVIHKNLLSPVFRVLKRPSIFYPGGNPVHFFPEDIVVANPDRVSERGYFILPKSEYVPCDSNGVVKDQHVDSAPLADCG